MSPHPFRPFHKRDARDILKFYERTWQEGFKGLAHVTAAGIEFVYNDRRTTRTLAQCRDAVLTRRDFQDFFREVAADVRWVEPGLR